MNSINRWWTFAVVSLALFMGMLDNLVVVTALPAIRQALGASVADLEWTVNAYTLAFTILLIPAAALGDRFGRRRVLLGGIALFTLGSALAALSDSATGLGLARALQGIGGAFITPLTLTILIRAFPPQQRTMIIGLWSGVSGLGLAAGPLIGGAIVQGLHWTAIFWVNVPIGLLLLVLGRLRLEESWGDRRPLDLPGVALVGGGLFGLVYGLIRGGAEGWTSPSIVAALTLGALLLVGFLLRERATRDPLVELAFFGRRGFAVANSVGFLMSFGMFGAIFFITLFVQEARGASPLQAGLQTMPWTGTIMLVAPLAGVITSRVGARLPLVVGMLSQAIALGWLGLAVDATTPYLQILPAFILGGMGMGLAFTPLSDAAISAVPGEGPRAGVRGLQHPARAGRRLRGRRPRGGLPAPTDRARPLHRGLPHRGADRRGGRGGRGLARIVPPGPVAPRHDRAGDTTLTSGPGRLQRRLNAGPGAHTLPATPTGWSGAAGLIV